MNGLGTSLIWGAVQVSLFCLVGAIVYVFSRRRGPAAGSLAALAAVLLVFGVSILSLSPWPRWWEMKPIPADESIVAKRDVAQANLREDEQVADSRGLSAGKAQIMDFAKPVQADNQAIWRAAWAALVEGLRQPAQQVAAEGWRWPAVVACLLLVGMVIGLIRHLAGLAAVERYRRCSCPVNDAELADLLAIVQAELSCTREIAIHESALLSAPAVVGWRKPLVLVPESWRSWTFEERRAVLAHEVAHIAHHDYASWVLAQFSLIANFYNPLVHWLVSRLRVEQELAADGCGARLAGGNQTYLTTLAGMALRMDSRRASWAARPFLPARGTFLRRIEMLRDAKSLGQPELAFMSRVLVIVALAGAALLTAGLRAPLAEGSPPNLLQGGGIDQPGGAKAPFTVDYLPPSAILAAAVRVQDVLNLSGGENLLVLLEPVKNLGIDIKDVEELKFAVLDLNVNSAWPVFQFSARGAKPIDWIALLRKKAMPNLQEVNYNGSKYYRAAEQPGQGPDICLYSPDARTIVGAPEARIRDLIQAGGKTPAPSWAVGWAEVATGQVALMIDTESLGRFLTAQPGKLAPDGFVAGVAPLWENSKLAFVGIHLDKNLAFRVISESGSEDAAQKVAKTLRAVVTLAENGLDGLKKQIETASDQEKAIAGPLLNIAADLTAHVKVDQKGKEVSLQTQSEKFGTNTVSAMLLPAVAKAREAASRTRSANNMKQLALAMHNYAAANGHLPAAAIVGPDGKTTHSWRVALLPYMEHDQLYKQYKMDEPWDSPSNRKVLEKMPKLFQAEEDPRSTASSYYVLTGKETIFSGPEGTKFTDITDGTSNTILVVEAKANIPWTKPEDLEYAAGKALPKFGGFFPQGFNAAFADGSVRFIMNSIAEQILRAAITKAGGEVIQGF
jgi:beta-lactamase regulating signal transducer with metallopeptidase domain